jgi:hypothetical protein
MILRRIAVLVLALTLAACVSKAAAVDAGLTDGEVRAGEMEAPARLAR